MTCLSTGVKAAPETQDDLFKAEDVREKQMKEFLQQRIFSDDVGYFEPMTRNKLGTFTWDEHNGSSELIG